MAKGCSFTLPGGTVGLGVGAGVGEGVGLAVGAGLGAGVGDGVGEGVGAGVGEGVPEPPSRRFSHNLRRRKCSIPHQLGFAVGPNHSGCLWRAQSQSPHLKTMKHISKI